MLVDDLGLIGAQRTAHQDRAQMRRSIALAIGRRAGDDARDWAQVADRIAAQSPDFAILLEFMRREPSLLHAYFGDASRVSPLSARCRPAGRLLVGFAHDMAMRRPVSIVDSTDDERLRVRMYELALIAGAREASTIKGAVEELALRTPEGISALVFLLLKMRRASAQSVPVQTIRGWPERRRRIFFWRYLAFTFQRRLSPFAAPAQTFGVTLNRDQQARVIRLQIPGHVAAAKRTGLPLLCQTVLRSGIPTASWLDLSLSLPRLARLVTAEFWTRLARSALGSQQAEEYLGRPRTLALMTRRFGADGVLHLYEHYCVRTLSEQTLENGARSSKKILKNFAGRYPQVLPPQALAKIEAFTSDRDTFITLVNDYLRGCAPDPDADIAGIVAAAFQTPEPIARALVESETGRRLMAALSQFKAKHDINLLRTIEFPADNPASPAGLDGYLYELRNAFAVELAAHVAQRGGRLVGPIAQRRLFASFFMREFETDRLASARVEAARDHLRRRAVDRINALLEAQNSDQRLGPDDMDALASQWRDTEPVLTVLARLNDPARRGGPSASASRLVLRAAKAAAERRFRAFKFDDIHGQRQIAFLSDAQRRAWMESRALVRIGGAERPGNQRQLEALSRQLDADLQALHASLPCEPLHLAPALRAEIAELASEEIKADPAIVAQRSLATHIGPEFMPAAARACLVDVSAQLNGAVLGGFEQRNVARIMRALVRIGYSGHGENEACQRVLAGLRAIEREIPRDMLDGETISQGLVATAFDCSPRLMLTIGDVVNTGCCLNYQSGGRINVLPGYLVDANIQALVSWPLKQTHFANIREYKAVLNAVIGGRPVAASFDGDRLVFRFAFPDGDGAADIETRSLGFAHLRQIVRLGRVRHGLSWRPGLLAERGYAQPHPLQALMHANHADILRALSTDLQAIDRRPLRFPQSRNPDGVYCDSLGGVKLYEYAVYMK